MLEDWVDSGGRIREAAIDLQGTSVDRELLRSKPSDCLAGAAVAVGAIAFCDIPDQFSAPPAEPYESVVVYAPEHGNMAHSEIQFWRAGATTASRPKSNLIKSQIKEAILKRMRIVCRREELPGNHRP